MCSVGDGDIDEQENAKFMVPRNGIKMYSTKLQINNFETNTFFFSV